MSRVLVVEDELHLANGLRFNLEAEGHQVQVADTGEAALDVLKAAPAGFDIVVLDVMLPGKDGFTVMSEMRDSGQFVPTLMLTARGHPADVLRGFAAGADDYLPKPFDLPELEARVRALLRRGRYAASSIIKHGSLTLDLVGRRAAVNGEPVDLSARELAVLEALLLSTGRVVSKDQLVEMIFTTNEDVGANAIEVYIHRFRKKVEHAGVDIRTIRGLGYLIDKQMHD